MRLEILVGPIASGKSTYCKIASMEGAIIVNDDAIVMAIHGGHYHLYDNSLKPLYKLTENTIIQGGLIMGKRVVVDRPNYSIAMRRRYISLAKSFDIPVRIVMMDRHSPEVHAKRRVEHDIRGYDYDYWLKVAFMHDSLYEPPNQEIENFDEIVKWEFSEI